MIRVIASCVWLIAATSVSAHVTATWNSGDARDSPQAKQSGAIRRNKTAPINVPMISNGNVQGYSVAQFVYLTDESSLHELSVPPDDFIADEAFRELYTSNVDFKHLEKYDVERLTKLLAQKTNLRLEKDIIKDILVAEFTLFLHVKFQSNAAGAAERRGAAQQRFRAGAFGPRTKQRFEAWGIGRIEMCRKLQLPNK